MKQPCALVQAGRLEQFDAADERFGFFVLICEQMRMSMVVNMHDDVGYVVGEAQMTN